MSKEREFSTEFNKLTNRSEYVIVCDCGTKTSMPSKGLGSHFPPEMIARTFANKGWEVGRKASDDKCPSCLAKRAQPRTIAVPKPETELETIVRTGKEIASTAPATDQKAIDRENRRKVFSKLSDTYNGNGYKEGWSDGRVSLELSVPRKLVAEIREEAFGDIGTNPELHKLAEDIEKVRKEVNPLIVAAEAAWQRAKTEMEACHQAFQAVEAQKLALEKLQSRAASIRGTA